MSQRQKRNPINDNAERIIVDYLRAHPEFFERHLDVLETLQLPHPVQPAVSLIERQVLLLRQQNTQLRKKLRDLVKVARDNDCLSKRMQHLNLTLIEARELDDMLNGIQSVLRDEFNADFTALRLATLGIRVPEQLNDHERLNGVALSLFAGVFESNQPVCGRLTNQQLRYLFDDAAPQVASAVLVPLQGMDWKGLMAIGSRDQKRFHTGMGTLFLSRIGELISHALQPHMQPSATIAS